MSLNSLEKDTIRAGFEAARLVLQKLEPVLHSLNVVYDAQGGVKETVDQVGLDEIEAYSGLTKAQLDDGFYALTTTIKGAIDNAYTQLTNLASRF